MAHPAPPALYTNDRIALVQDAEINGSLDTELETVIDILLPWLRVEIRLWLGESEGVDAAIEMGVL